MTLLFRVAELCREIQSLRTLGRNFLDPSATGVLGAVESGLVQISLRAGSGEWEIAQNWPLRTVVSNGEYQTGRTGGRAVHAAVTFVWELTPQRRPGARHGPSQVVRLTGKASTMIHVYEGPPESPGHELAMWRMEVADPASPGSYFHVQILGRESDPIFPKSLDVPRLPGMLVTPFACVEFILAELFQDRWRTHADRDFRDVRDWKGVQATRMLAQLDWHAKTVRAASGSPWSAWKREVPAEDLFTAAW